MGAHPSAPCTVGGRAAVFVWREQAHLGVLLAPGHQMVTSGDFVQGWALDTWQPVGTQRELSSPREQSMTAENNQCLRGGRLSFGAWLALVVGGYLYVAGVLCGRANPIHSDNGAVDFFLVVLLCPLFYYLGPRHNWPPARRSAGTILTWNGLCYTLPFFLALHWAFLGPALGVRFALKSSDLGSLSSRSAVVLGVGLVALAVLLASHLVQARGAGILRGYLAALLGIPCALGIITMSLGDGHYLHVHHYNWGAFLFPFFRFRNVSSLVVQALCLGIAVEGIARWGMDPVWYAVPPA